MPKRGWPLGEGEDQTPIDSQSYRHVESHSRYPIGETQKPFSLNARRFGPRAIDVASLPIDLSMRNIQEQRRNPDGSYTSVNDDTPVVEGFLQRIVNYLDILSKPKIIRKSFVTRQITLVANAVAALLIDAQTLRGYIVQNTSGVTAYIGAGGVTASSGFSLQPNVPYEFYLEEGVKLYAFSSGNAVIQIIEL